jgi:hypothetical protein
MFWNYFGVIGMMGLIDLSSDLESKGEKVTRQIVLKYTFKKILLQILNRYSELVFM